MNIPDIPEKLKNIIKVILEKKAEDPVLISVGEICGIADYFLIVTSNSDIHARTIADEIKKELKKDGVTPFGVEGYGSAGWILMDYGDVIVHILRQDLRELYALEYLWMDAPQFSVKEDSEGKVSFAESELQKEKPRG